MRRVKKANAKTVVQKRTNRVWGETILDQNHRASTCPQTENEESCHSLSDQPDFESKLLSDSFALAWSHVF